MIPLDDLIGCFSFVRENSIKSFVLLNFGGKLQHMNLDVFFAVCKRYKVDYYHATEKQRAFIDAVAAHEFSMKQAHEKGLNRSSVPPFMGIKRSERSNNRPA